MSLSVGISEVRSVQSVNLAGLPVIARFESETVDPNQSKGISKKNKNHF